MIHIAVRVRDLATSNITTLVNKSSNPTRSLGLLRSQIEETLIELTGDLTKAKRHLERAEAHAATLSNQAAEWTSKAKVAMDHGREDLARSALIAREAGETKAEAARKDVAEMEANIEELEGVIVQLEAKRKDAIDQIAQRAAHSQSGQGGTASAANDADSKAARRMDRIDALERRVAMRDEAIDNKDETQTEADIEAEIAGLARDSKIDAELAAMKASPAKKRAPSKKAK